MQHVIASIFELLDSPSPFLESSSKSGMYEVTSNIGTSHVISQCSFSEQRLLNELFSSVLLLPKDSPHPFPYYLLQGDGKL